jgi:hypothetical protein
MFFVAVRRTLKTLGEKHLIKPQLVITTLMAAQHTVCAWLHAHAALKLYAHSTRNKAQPKKRR